VQAAESTPERRHPGSPRKRVVARAVHVDGAAIGLYRRRQRLQVGPAGRAQRAAPWHGPRSACTALRLKTTVCQHHIRLFIPIAI
jgi:hypothetical protein